MGARGQSRGEASGTIYLLHFSGRTRDGEQHYLGWTENLERRYTEHRTGCGCRETSKAVAEGLKLTVVQTWAGTPLLEMRLKKWSRKGRKGFAGICPFCAGQSELPDGLVQALGAPVARSRVTVQPRS